MTPEPTTAGPAVATAGERDAGREGGRAPTGAAPLDFDILGSVRARRGDREVDLGPAKQRAVLAVLLLEANRPVPPARIVDAVWGVEPPGNGANVVQKYVAGLRRVLEPHRSPRTPSRLLTLQPAGYQLAVEPGRLDADAFATQVRRAAAAAEAGSLDEAARQLAAALGRWRGEPLAGLSGPVFESARQRLADRRAAASELRAEVLLQSGRHADLLPELVRLVEEFPLRERIRYLHMLALYRCGRQAEALAAYTDARRRLVEEFAVEPGEPLRRLHTQILRSDPALAAPTPAAPTKSGHGAPQANGAIPGWPSGPDPAGPALSGPGTAPDYAAPMGTAQEALEPRWAAPGGTAPSPVGNRPVWTQPVWTRPVWTAPPPVGTQPPGPAPSPSQPAMAKPAAEPPRWRSRTARTIAVLVPLLTLGLATWLVFGWLAAWFRQRRPGYLAAAYLALTVVWLIGIDAPDPDAPLTLWSGIGLVAFLLAWLGGTAHLALLMFAPRRPH